MVMKPGKLQRSWVARFMLDGVVHNHVLHSYTVPVHMPVHIYIYIYIHIQFGQ